MCVCVWLFAIYWVRIESNRTMAKGDMPTGMGAFVCFATYMIPNRLIKWAETSHGGGVGPWDWHRVDMSQPHPGCVS